MTTYHPTSLKLTEPQVERLLAGETVRLKPANLVGGNVSLPLTATQMRRISKCTSSGKGLDLKLSPAQIRAHHRKEGGALNLKDIASSLAQAASSVAPVAKSLAENLLREEGPKVIEKASDAISHLASSHIPADLQPFLDMGLKYGSQFTTKQLQHLLNGMSQTKNGKGLYLPGGH